MFNPFERRATEHLRDDEAFLAVVTPEPIKAHLAKAAEQGKLYDTLVVIRGTPGSGKTTIARVFEFGVIMTVLRNIESHRPLMSTLSECKAIVAERPLLLAARLPLETAEYREIWEFPYPEDVKNNLLIAFIQARTILGWGRQLARLAPSFSNVALHTTGGSVALVNGAGATSFQSLIETATKVEESVFKVIGSLVPPRLDSLRVEEANSYRPFDVLDKVELLFLSDSSKWILHPLVVLDDVNTLHPAQFAFLQRWLIRRELKVGRWLLTRLDALRPEEAFSLAQAESPDATLPGVTVSREITEISLQSGAGRRDQRVLFRKMARDMANRYMRQMPIFSSRKLDDFPRLLSDRAATISASKLKELRSKVDGEQARLKISDSRRGQLEGLIGEYKADIPVDETLAILKILLNRYARRVDQKQLFGAEDPDPKRPIRVDSGIHEAACIYLLHEFNKAFYFGFDDMCDASSENAEQFLRLAAILVDAISTRLIRAQPATLNPEQQSKLLRDRARQFMDAWTFPQHETVLEVVKFIGDTALQESLQPSAWIGSGANAYGIPQEEFDTLTRVSPDLANVLKYGMAYNALTLVPNYDCQGATWCLLELGGLPCLRYGLTLKRGGFKKGTTERLLRVIRK